MATKRSSRGCKTLWSRPSRPLRKPALHRHASPNIATAIKNMANLFLPFLNIPESFPKSKYLNPRNNPSIPLRGIPGLFLGHLPMHLHHPRPKKVLGHPSKSLRDFSECPSDPVPEPPTPHPMSRILVHLVAPVVQWGEKGGRRGGKGGGSSPPAHSPPPSSLPTL